MQKFFLQNFPLFFNILDANVFSSIFSSKLSLSNFFSRFSVLSKIFSQKVSSKNFVGERKILKSKKKKRSEQLDPGSFPTQGLATKWKMNF